MTMAFKCSKPEAILKTKKMQTIAVQYKCKDEKVMHGRSNVNEIVSAGGTNFQTETLDKLIAIFKRTLVKSCNLCVFLRFLHDTLICIRLVLG